MSSLKTFARNFQGQLKFYIYHNVLLLLISPPALRPSTPEATITAKRNPDPAE